MVVWWEPGQTFFQTFLLFVVAGTATADIAVVVVDNVVVVVIGSIVVVDVVVELE